MRGQTVVCKDFMGTPLVRVLWEESGDLIFIHTEDQFQARRNGLPCLDAVGFSTDDVFEYNEAALQATDPWGELTPYRASLDRNLEASRNAQRTSPTEKANPLSEVC